MNTFKLMLSRLPFFTLALVLPLSLAACGGDPAENPEGAMQGAPPAPPAETEVLSAEPRMEDGVQVVEIEAGPRGYQPREVQLQAGVPARLVFTRTVESDCSSKVKIPAFDVAETELPVNEPVAIEFTPTESGEFEFVCGMDMQRGSIMIRS